MTRRRSPKGTPADDLAARVAAIEAFAVSMGEVLAQIAASCGDIAGEAHKLIGQIAEQQAVHSAAIERLTAEAGLIDQPNNTHH